MAKKKHSNPPVQKKKQDNKKSHNNHHQPSNGSSSSSSASKKSGLVFPVWICVVAGLLSLSLGLLTPHFLRHQSSTTASSTTNKYRDLQKKKTMSSQQQQQQQQQQQEQQESDVTMTDRLHPPPEFACTSDRLSQVLHDKPVAGMHVVCLNQTMASLQIVFYPNAQHTSNPPSIQLEGLPAWDGFQDALVTHLQLTPMDELHQPWAVFSPDGELLLREDNEHVQMDGVASMGMVLVFQGGQFIWPGVKIGFRRTIPLHHDSTSTTSAKKQTATLETISLEPLVFAVDGFLGEEECDFFQTQATPSMAYSEVTLMDMDKGRPASDFRTSQSTFLTDNTHPMISEIDYRTASLVRVPRVHQENVQVLRYGNGEKYDAHHDYFDKQLYQNDPSTLRNFIQYGRRNRMITVFWYLSDVEEGGETIFPRFGGAPPPRNMADCQTGLKVKPARGKVIIFYSLKPDGSLDPLSLHGACPVRKGIKWAANKWVWNLPIPEFGSGR